MKRIVSVSLGASGRNHAVETTLLGSRFRIERIGTDGDIGKALRLIKELDGKVDAFGMGGIDLYIQTGRKKYVMRDAKRISCAAKVTPIVDGTGLKDTLERKTIEYLADTGIINFAEKKVLLVCGVDRFGMAEALVKHGAIMTFGDLIFGLNFPVPIRSLEKLAFTAGLLGPIVSKLPFKLLYPTGSRQEVITDKYSKYYNENEVIAGDFLYIKKYLPRRVEGKIILTNTVTTEDVELLKQRGASHLITTTPEFNGRSFGTNVMEALLVALLEKPIAEITNENYLELLERLEFKPRIIKLS